MALKRKQNAGELQTRLLDIELEPAELFSALAYTPAAAFLDSALVDEHRLGTWSFIVWDPFLSMSSRENTVCYRIGHSLRWESDNPWHSISRTLSFFHLEEETALIPFTGGAVGYLGYDMGQYIERLPRTAIDDLHLPECLLRFYDTVLAYDHSMNQWYLCHTNFGYPHRPTADQREQEVKMLVLKAREDYEEVQPVNMLSPLKSNFLPEQYRAAVLKAKEYIREGEIYQVNLSQRFQTAIEQDGWMLYRRLRETNAAPFMAFLQEGAFQVASSSPERFLKVEGDRVETRPIKGTRPRGETPRQDAWYRAELLSSEKDRAELNMIVDLERNDLGRVCSYGTVKVTRHAVCESYARVHHLVSTVEGRLYGQRNTVDLLKAAFPGGSITGAPKIRAMEIIDELEPHSRGAYTGSIGYLNFNGDLDLNIAIRTMTVIDRQVFFNSGGGIVIDSDPEMEYEETLHKAHAMVEALGGTFGGF